MKGRIISFIVAFALLGALIYYSGFEKIIQVVMKADVPLLLFSFMLWPIGVTLRTKRWRYLLSKVGCVPPWMLSVKVFIASLFLSNITPGKSGDPLRSVLLKKANGDSVALTLPSVIVERILDITSLTFMGAIGLFLMFSSIQSDIFTWFMAAMAVYAVAIIFGLFLLASESRIKTFSNLVFKVFFFIPKLKTYAGKIESFAANLRSSFAIYSSKRTILMSFTYSLVLWLFEGFIVWLSFRILGFDVPFLVILTAMCVCTLISVLTFLPGGIGSSEAIMVVFMTSVTTLTAADIVAAGLLLRLISYWVYITLGTIILSTMKYDHKL